MSSGRRQLGDSWTSRIATGPPKRPRSDELRITRHLFCVGRQGSVDGIESPGGEEKNG
jgi:hypothetical protein